MRPEDFTKKLRILVLINRLKKSSHSVGQSLQSESAKREKNVEVSRAGSKLCPGVDMEISLLGGLNTLQG